MSRRGRGRGGSNSVRGPASALTAFLREQGITTGPISAYDTTLNVTPEDDENEGLDGDEATVVEEGPSVAGPSTASASTPVKKASEKRKTGNDSDDLDSEDDQTSKPAPSKKRKIVTDKGKGKAKEAAKKGEKGEGDENDPYNARSKGKSVNVNKAPDIGSFNNCAECGDKFTFTRYTMPASPPPGYLCHKCAKATGQDPFKKSAPKRKAPQEKRKIVHIDETSQVISLAQMCISIIGKNIDEVETLGDIGPSHLDSIAKILAKNRKLTAEIAPLFYDVGNTVLTMYDCTPLLPDAYRALASLNPNLRRLRVDFCGRMDDGVLEHWTEQLAHLDDAEFLGPFNVRTEAWVSFIKGLTKPLERLSITQSPRFDLECMNALTSRCSRKMTDLRLCEVGQLNDDYLHLIGRFKSLTSLDISHPSRSLSDDAVIELLECIGANLEHLNISGNDALTDDVLENGIKAHTRKLMSLKASHTQFTNDGVAAFFTDNNMPPLHTLDLSRIHELSSEVLSALTHHSGRQLVELNINSWKDTSNESLMALAQGAAALKKIDLGWCRQMDNFVIKALLDHCNDLAEILCFGCNKITEECPRRRGVVIRGIEGYHGI